MEAETEVEVEAGAEAFVSRPCASESCTGGLIAAWTAAGNALTRGVGPSNMLMPIPIPKPNPPNPNPIPLADAPNAKARGVGAARSKSIPSSDSIEGMPFISTSLGADAAKNGVVVLLLLLLLLLLLPVPLLFAEVVDGPPKGEREGG